MSVSEAGSGKGGEEGRRRGEQDISSAIAVSLTDSVAGRAAGSLSSSRSTSEDDRPRRLVPGWILGGNGGTQGREGGSGRLLTVQCGDRIVFEYYRNSCKSLSLQQRCVRSFLLTSKC